MSEPFAIGDRVTMRYGPGTIVALVPDRSGQGRAPLIVVHADVGPAWFCDPSEVTPLDPYALRCPVCEGLDYPGLSHNPEAPYCSQWKAGRGQ